MAILCSDATPARARREARALGYLILADGRERAISEAMVDLALRHAEVRGLSLHGRDHAGTETEVTVHG
jgi:hypothetical protein